MSSPFSTIEEFNNALDGPTEGAIYTFANAPIINILALIAAVGIFIWFMVSTYTVHTESPPLSKSLDRLSSFIVIGLLSLVAADYRQSSQRDRSTTTRHRPTLTSPLHSAKRTLPLGLLGMVSAGLPSFRQSKKKSGKFRKRRLSQKHWR